MERTFKFQERDPKSVQQATLCFLVRGEGKEREVLLAMKLRGFGEGLWNGLGGKFDPGKGDKTIKDTAIREGEEEGNITPKSMQKVAKLHFYFPDDPKKKNWNQDVHVFLVTEWEGEIEESTEMKPEWHKVSDIPYENMWDDDYLWLPGVLAGRKTVGKFAFDSDNKVMAHKLELVDYVERSRKKAIKR